MSGGIAVDLPALVLLVHVDLRTEGSVRRGIVTQGTCGETLFSLLSDNSACEGIKERVGSPEEMGDTGALGRVDELHVGLFVFSLELLDTLLH